MADRPAIGREAEFEALMNRLLAIAQTKPWTVFDWASRRWSRLPPSVQQAVAAVIDRTLLTERPDGKP
jgi:hypothetical protein